MTVPWVDLSLVSTAWHVVPVKVPRLIPRVAVLSGPSVVNVAVTVPLADVVKLCVTPLFWFTLPVKVSLMQPLTSVRLQRGVVGAVGRPASLPRSEEHTSELQSLRHLVCR